MEKDAWLLHEGLGVSVHEEGRAQQGREKCEVGGVRRQCVGGGQELTRALSEGLLGQRTDRQEGSLGTDRVSCAVGQGLQREVLIQWRPVLSDPGAPLSPEGRVTRRSQMRVPHGVCSGV